jgi:GntR family transcriptional regulator, vanillate catabolism transcriptional regulator
MGDEWIQTSQMATRESRIVVELREMILRGDLAPGERLGEVALAERLGVSRTPIRHALPALAREGLLAPAGARGYVVRAFSARDVLEALDVRGVLEGLAARMVAERGASSELLRELRRCLADGDEIFARGHLLETDESRYSELNGRFHALIVEAAGSRAIGDALARNDHVPFAAARAVAFDRLDKDSMFDILRYAHRQHHAIARALEAGEGARAEALMREHTAPVKESLNLARELPGGRSDAPVGFDYRSGTAGSTPVTARRRPPATAG